MGEEDDMKKRQVWLPAVFAVGLGAALGYAAAGGRFGAAGREAGPDKPDAGPRSGESASPGQPGTKSLGRPVAPSLPPVHPGAIPGEGEGTESRTGPSLGEGESAEGSKQDE